jgi:antitoxin VapB
LALSIKNRKAEQLAQSVAKQTGETLTQAVITALEERLERIAGRRSAPDVLETLLEISRRCSQLPDLDQRSSDEILGYDESGTFEGEDGH